MSKKTLSLEDIESSVALDLPDRELMSWVSIAILNGATIEKSFNTFVDAQNSCVQFLNIGAQSCEVEEE
jgi:dephospho-CoA kinase